MKKIGFLTSGGDCQSLNATMRGVAKTLYQTYSDVVMMKQHLSMMLKQRILTR